jgi:Nif-specific regulatory protein
MAPVGAQPHRERLANERDFYRRLLDLGGEQEIEPLLDQALALIVEVTKASMGYLELYDDESGQPRYWKGYGLSDRDVASIRGSISRGIITRAISEGKTIETPSATEDQRFSDLRSVRQHAIQAVLCAPVGKPQPIGVVYLQGPGTFTAEDREHTELFARQLAPLADRLVRRSAGERVDQTETIRRRLQCPEIIGRSRALAQLLQAACNVAGLEVALLITGPSGTGKSMLARTIHDNGPRSGGPFVAINCATVPETLFESEMFGAERGAHSTATRRMQGKVTAADGGTLFLDEVAELSPGNQAKLLQFLATHEYQALGSTSTMRADVRIISATNANLKERVADRRFREDLFFRLHVVRLEVPGLEARRDDIPDLVEHFVTEACRKHGFSPLAVSRRTLAMCRNAAWPGHTRELEHAIEAAVISAHGEEAEMLQPQHVFPELEPRPEPLTLEDATWEFQRQFVLEALQRNNGNVTRTAQELGLGRSHMYNRLRELGLATLKKTGEDA